MRKSMFVLPGTVVLAAVIAGSWFFSPIESAPPSPVATTRPANSTTALPVWPMSGTTRASGETPLREAGAEALLAQVFREIEQRNLGQALTLTDALLQRYPNYRLAHLIKGDLLLARTNPIQGFGALAGAPREKVEDLRAEALKRLRGYREKPQADYVPRYLLQMHPDQRHAVVVDTERSRLYLYENDLSNGGRPRFVADYYITQGKLGANKSYEGDKRTPIGVYHVTANLSRQKLPDLYGSGAFPLNYPNELDKREGRGGSGIWLHGTPSNTFARPPLASDGCVVLTNQDLDSIAGNMQVGLTPVIISNTVEWLSLDDWSREREAFNQSIEAWRSDWESRDHERYLSHYSKTFKANGQNFEQFAAQKRQVNASKTWIKLKLDNLSMFRNPGKEDVVVVTFEQDYQSNNLNNRMKKRQYWTREDGQWKIIYEGVA